jgi:hypothetical protein
MSLNRNGFQQFVNRDPAPGVVGAFAGMNPRATVLGGAGQYKAAAAPNQPIVGNFAWFDPATGLASKVLAANTVLAFVANELQANIPFPPPNADPNMHTLTTLEGFPVTGFTHGDFWAAVAGGAVAPGATIYADATNGAPTVDDNAGANPDTGFKAMSAAAVDATAATCLIAAGTGVLTVGGAITGVVQVGANLSGTGVPANLFVVAQLSGTPGGAGTYQVNYTGPAVPNFAATFSTGKLVKISRTY